MCGAEHCVRIASRRTSPGTRTAAPPITISSAAAALTSFGAEQLMRKPRDLYDAWLLSIIVPLVEIARDDTKIFLDRHNRDGRCNLLPLEFDISDEPWDTALDWSRSNLERLFDVGYRSAQRFLADEGAGLLRRRAVERA